MEGVGSDIFGKCEEIRELLRKNGLTSLPISFPIEEIRISEAERGWLGITEIFVKGKSARILRVGLALKDGNGNEIGLDRIIPTLLHEFAHCLPPYGLPKEHSSAFYQNLATVLRIAESVGIWERQASDKYSERSLQRWDSMHNSSDVPSMWGFSKLYPKESSSDTKTESTTLRFTLISPEGKRKMVKISDISWEKVEKEVRQKFRVKLKTLRTPNGQQIQREEISTLPSDCSLLFQ